MSEVVLVPYIQESTLTSLFAPTPGAAKRTLEFFTTQIHNDHTRRAYVQAIRTFSVWCDGKGIGELDQVEPIHVAAFIKELGQHRAAPTVKQHLAALRMLFDWLVTGHVLLVNPAHAVRGPKHVVKKGKTPVLTAEEARALLNSIPTGSLVGLRDRALIGVMTYTFARVNAAVELKGKDYYVQGRRGWLHLREKAARSTMCPAITLSNVFSTNTLRQQKSKARRKPRCFARWPAEPVR